ncbi:hypothetical protein [Paratractidigestivibacter faecalis]|uniref:hypothetical protein n=1 Tax=Paratractidigestivibacter faecalis TaxID=2292441 RepID=UPI003D75976C
MTTRSTRDLSTLDLDPDERIFPVTKYFLSHEMARGSKAADITYRYAHLFPSVQANMARTLDGARKES